MLGFRLSFATYFDECIFQYHVIEYSTESTFFTLFLQCANCKKPFSVAMLQESKETGHNLCVFCRMDQKPTIWSVVENILNTESMDEEEQQEEEL